MPNKLTNAEIQKIIPLIEQTKWHYRLDKFTDDSLKLVNKSVNQARREVAAKLATINPKSEFTKQRLETLAQELQDMTVAIQHKITGQIENVVTEVAAKSYKKHADILSFGGLVPNFNAVQLTAVQLKSIVDTPVGGKLLDEWVDTSFTANIKDKFQEGIATGMLKGESYKSLVKRFKTEAFTGLEKDMEAITRTQVQTINTNAMQDTMKANADIMKGWKWNSVYENRTCIRCMSLDAKGEVYPIDGGPPIPLHINCRCFPEPITKTFRELGVDIDEVKDSYRPYTIRGKIDPVTGRVIPGKIGVGGGRIIDTGRFLGNYDDFFKQLPENVQMQMLGPTRFGKYKEGKLTLAGLTDEKGNAFLIKELTGGVKKSSFTMVVDESLIKTAAKALSEKEILSNADLINKAMLKKAKDLDIEEEFMILTAPRSYSPSNSYWSSRPLAAGETKAQLELEGWVVDGKEVYYQKTPPKWMPKDLAGKQLSSTFASNVNLQSYFGEPPNIPAMENFKKMLEGKYGKKFQLSAELVQKNNQAIFREMYGESTKFYRAGGVKPGVQSMSESTSAAKHAASVVGKTSKVTSEGVEVFEHQILVSHRGFVTPFPEKEWVVDLSAKAAAKEKAQVAKFTLPSAEDLSVKALEKNQKKFNTTIINSFDSDVPKTPTELKKSVESKLKSRMVALSEADQADYLEFQNHFKRDFSAKRHVPERDLISKWATTSGDEDELATFMQMMAKEEFSLKDPVTDHLLSEMRSHTLGTALRSDSVKNGARKFLREMYNETQEQFAAQGIKELTLFRGVHYEKGIGPNVSGIFKNSMQPISSFSTKIDEAIAFTQSGKGEFRSIMSVKVPVNRILSSPSSGYGCYSEREIVVLGENFKSINLVRKSRFVPDDVLRDLVDVRSGKDPVKLAIERKAAEQAAKKAAQMAKIVEAEKKAKKLAEKLAKEEAERLAAKKLAEKLAKEEAARKAKELAERLAREKAAKELAEKLAREKAAKLAAEKLAREKAAKLAAEKARIKKLAEEAKKVAEELAKKLELKKLEEKLQKELAEAVAKKEAAEKLAKEKLEKEAAAKTKMEKLAKEKATWVNVKTVDEAKTALKNYRILNINSQLTKKQTINYVNNAGKHLDDMFTANPSLGNYLIKNKPFVSLDLIDTKQLANGGAGTYIPDLDLIKVAGKLKKGSNAEIGYYTIGDKADDILRHELGHVIYFKTLSQDTRIAFTRAARRGALKEGIKIKEWQKKYISEYGSANREEGFAEAFSLWSHPEYAKMAKKLPKELDEYFEEIFK